MKILIVEDEVRLADTLCQLMIEQKYLADVVYDGASGLDYALSGIYDVIILDVMLPKMNGFDVVHSLRLQKIATPVLLLTAKDDISDKVTGLDHGADDYLTKPFIADELLARIRALTRRQSNIILDELTFGDLTLNLSTYFLSCGMRSVRLGMKEFEIMRLLLLRPGIVVSKDTLISQIWGEESNVEDNNVEVYISFLRKKALYLNSRVSISTIRKIGYYLEEVIS